MLKSLRPYFLFLLVTMLVRSLAFGQELQDTTAAFKWFDGVVGVENTVLFNGIEYIEQHVTVNERQKFLGSILFTPGSIVYEKQPYYDVDIKYNVYDDVLLLRGPGTSPLQLHTSRVQEFNIHGIDFINITSGSTATAAGFHEVLLENQTMVLLKKHTKKLRKYLDRSFIYFEFEDDIPKYVIAYQGEYHSWNSRREVINAFPDLAGEIRRFYREEQSLAKMNPDLFMTKLAGRLFQMSASNPIEE